MNVQVNMQEGIGATINSYSAQGYRLCGMGIAGGATTTKFAGASSTSLAELVFQKVDPALPSSCMILQAAESPAGPAPTITTSTSMDSRAGNSSLIDECLSGIKMA